jgi:hypothetical protein
MAQAATRVLVLSFVAALVLRAGPADAGSHLWRFSEFYSSPDRSVQFIEMQEIGGSDDETHISTRWFATDDYNQDHTETLGSNLPAGTANKKFLVGTESYAALPGVPAPDYVFPDGFLDPSGDTVVWWFYQTMTIPVGVMPSNGSLSLHVDNPPAPTGFSVGVNSPTNFAGDTGTVSLAQSLPSLSVWAMGLVSALLAAIAWLRLGGRSGSGIRTRFPHR